MKDERQCLLKEDSTDNGRSVLHYRLSAGIFPEFSSGQATKTVRYANVETGPSKQEANVLSKVRKRD